VRLWSLHPCYLDSKGLVALWREGLLALAVLKGNTKGYQNHPQLKRFQLARDPLNAMKRYLWPVFEESKARGYRFDSGKLGRIGRCATLKVTRGQLKYELEHLKAKLKERDPKRYEAILNVRTPKPHPLFEIVGGPAEEWEKQPRSRRFRTRSALPGRR
jgi:hypothetical protein